MDIEIALELAALGAINDNELEEVIIRIIFEDTDREERFLRCTKYERLNLEKLTDEEVKKYFRFGRQDLIALCTLLEIPKLIKTEVGYVATGVEALCMLLRRLAYPNRLIDLEPMFGVSAEYISAVVNFTMYHILQSKGHLLEDLRNLPWLNQCRLQYYSNCVMQKGAPLQNCWGFIDGTARAICRPTVNQEEYFSGHKRYHCVKYQSVAAPDGIIVSLLGPFKGRRHDAGIFRKTNLHQQLQECAVFGEEKYVLYGDPAYPIQDVLLCPYAGRNLDDNRQNFNTQMSQVRQAVEWDFAKVVNEFAFIDFRKNQKIMLQDVSNMYKVAVLLANCHSCLYGNQTQDYFHCQPPTLQQYLGAN